MKSELKMAVFSIPCWSLKLESELRDTLAGPFIAAFEWKSELNIPWSLAKNHKIGVLTVWRKP